MTLAASPGRVGVVACADFVQAREDGKALTVETETEGAVREVAHAQLLPRLIVYVAGVLQSQRVQTEGGEGSADRRSRGR